MKLAKKVFSPVGYYDYTQLPVWIHNNIFGRVPIPCIRNFFANTLLGVDFSKDSAVLQNVRFARRKNFSIGSGSVLNNDCQIDNRFPVTIGENCSISYGTKILTKGHDIDSPIFKTKGGPVVVENYVWVCAFSIISPNVKLGEGCVVLPGSVVVKDVDPYTVVGGNPAKYVRKRSTDLKYIPKWNPCFPMWS